MRPADQGVVKVTATDTHVSMLDAALAYAARGLHVFPCWWPDPAKPAGCACGKPPGKGEGFCGSPAKHPLTPHGFRDATTDEATIRAWWRRWPQANVAIRTGPESDIDAIDVDVDEKGDGRVELGDLESLHGALPVGPYVHTQRDGYHFVFRHVPGLKSLSGKNGGKIAPHIDQRGEGGYIVAPPSVGLLGTYRWGVPLDGAEIPTMPEWLKALALREAPKASPTAPQPRAAAGATRAESDVTAAVAAYNQARPREYPKSRGECPACGEGGCFGHLPDNPSRWSCFNSDHMTKAPGCGRLAPSGTCVTGDALDLDAFHARLSRVALLRRDGYLADAGRPVAAGADTATTATPTATPAEAGTTYAAGGGPVEMTDLDALDVGARDAADIAAEEVEPLDEFWPGVIVRGLFTLLYGPAKAGKSWLVTAFMTAVGRGLPWAGNVRTGKPPRFLYVTEEGKRTKRLQFRRFGIPPGVATVFTPDKLPAAWSWDHKARTILEYAKARGYDVVVFDTLLGLAGLGPKDANDDGAVGSALSPIIVGSRRHDIAVVGIHHARREDGATFGALAFRREPDVLAKLSIEGAEDSTDRKLTTLGRLDPIDPVLLRYVERYDDAAEASEPDVFQHLGSPSSAKKTACEGKALDLLRAHDAWFTQDAAALSVGGRKAAALDALKALAARGAIQARDDGGAKAATLYAAHGVAPLAPVHRKAIKRGDK